MRVPISWLREYAPVPADVPATAISAALIRAGLEVERVEPVGADVTGVVVGEVVAYDEEPQKNGKTVRWCQIRVAEGQEPRGIVCGANNFAVGDRVPVALPGAVLPGNFTITARKTYGHVSDGMICSTVELGIGADAAGILVLSADAPLGADVIELLAARDDVLDIAVTPDRSDCLSVRGVARESATAFGVDFHDPAAVAVTASAGGYPVRVEAADACSRYVARVVRGVDAGAESPEWLQRRLALAGMRSISLAVDITNYVLLAVGQPLHAFDLAKLTGDIVVRRASAGEKLRSLDAVDRTLHAEDLVIADDSGAIALAGVMGGASTEVDATTRDIVVESALFDPVVVARAARRHKLPSEAAKRFERGVDRELAAAAAQLAVQLLVDLGGGTADPGATDIDLRPARETIALDPALPGRIAGVEYSADTVRTRLQQVGCAIDGEFVVTPPPWRPDLRFPIDLVDEVVRLEGYDAIPPALPPAPAGRGLTRVQRQRRSAARALAATGYLEVLTYPFVTAGMLDMFGVGADDERRRLVRLANPLSDDEPFLRTTLLPGLLAAAVRNVGRGAADLALFEAGSVFVGRTSPAEHVPSPPTDQRPTDAQLAALDALLPEQPRHVAGVAFGNVERSGWWGAGRDADWSDAVAAAREIAWAVGAEVTVGQATYAPWHPGRCAELTAGGRVVGYAGELHPRVSAALGLPGRVSAFELDLDALCAAAPETARVPGLSAYPPAGRDVALVVPDDVPAAEVEAALRAGAGELLETVRLFDIYAGAQVGEGARSLAFAMRFRAPDRTLTDEEANAARDAAVAAAAERTGAALRS